MNSVVGNLHEHPSLSSLLLAGAMGSDGTGAEWENTAGLVQQRQRARGSVQNFDFSKNGTVCVVGSN